MSAPYSYTAFSHGVADLTISGVKRKYRNIPDQLSTADLPCQFTRIPQGNERPLTADGQGGWPNRTIELVIVASPVGQSRQPTNQELVLTLIDALCTTLRAVPANNTISQAKLSWAIRGQINFIGPTEYWHIVTTITGNG